MELNIDPVLSVFGLAQRSQLHRTMISHRLTMNVISYEIENTTIMDGARTRVFAGFQRMSRFIPQVPRYRKLAATAESVYVFGIPDITPPSIDGVTYIPLLPSDQLAREWFLISFGPGYASTLATEEVSDPNSDDRDRMFRGIWTFDPTLTLILSEWMTRVVNAAPFAVDESAFDIDSHTRYISQINARITTRLNRPVASTRQRQTKRELQTVISSVLTTATDPLPSI